MVRSIDLNSDVGEGADDEALYALVSSVSIACGGHAGDPETMREAILRAKSHHVRIGAHPSYPDRQGMGRRSIDISMHDLRISLLEQIDALMRVADGLRASITHCKPHGALYNDAADDPVLAGLIAETVADRHPELQIVGLAGSALMDACNDAGVLFVGEGFADRAYRDGRLVPRDEPEALLTTPNQVAAQARSLLENPSIGTICVHGDTPGALVLAAAVRDALETAGARISAGV